MLPGTPARPQRPGRPRKRDWELQPRPSRWGRGGVFQPPLYTSGGGEGAFLVSPTPGPQMLPQHPPPTPIAGRRLPEGPGAWLMAHPSLLWTWDMPSFPPTPALLLTSVT